MKNNDDSGKKVRVREILRTISSLAAIAGGISALIYLLNNEPVFITITAILAPIGLFSYAMFAYTFIKH